MRRRHDLVCPSRVHPLDVPLSVAYGISSITVGSNSVVKDIVWKTFAYCRL